MSIAESIRLFLDTVFHSRLVRRLESDLIEARAMYQESLAVRDRQIAAYRQDIQYLQGVLSQQVFESRARQSVPKLPTTPTFIDDNQIPGADWQSALKHWCQTVEETETKENQDGTQSERRESVHELQRGQETRSPAESQHAGA